MPVHVHGDGGARDPVGGGLQHVGPDGVALLLVTLVEVILLLDLALMYDVPEIFVYVVLAAPLLDF